LVRSVLPAVAGPPGSGASQAGTARCVGLGWQAERMTGTDACMISVSSGF
jgi:hypothetical protein